MHSYSTNAILSIVNANKTGALFLGLHSYNCFFFLVFKSCLNGDIAALLLGAYYFLACCLFISGSDTFFQLTRSLIFNFI